MEQGGGSEEAKLLAAQIRLSKVSHELHEKQEEINNRLAVCRQRQANLERRRDEIKAWKNNFLHYVQENEEKRRRAETGAESDTMFREEMGEAMDEIEDEERDTRDRREKLREIIVLYKKYHDFLAQVNQQIPELYNADDSANNMFSSLIQKMQALQVVSVEVLHQLPHLQEQLDECKAGVSLALSRHEKTVSQCSLQLSRLERRAAGLRSVYHRYHMVEDRKEEVIRDKISDCGEIEVRLDGLFNNCSQTVKAIHGTDYHPGTFSYQQKLQIIKEHILDNDDMIQEIEVDLS